MCVGLGLQGVGEGLVSQVLGVGQGGPGHPSEALSAPMGPRIPGEGW